MQDPRAVTQGNGCGAVWLPATVLWHGGFEAANDGESMALETPQGADFEIGRVIRRTLDVLGRNAVVFFALALLLTAPNIALDYTGVFAFRAAGFGFASIGLGLFGALSVGYLVYFAFHTLLQAALAHGTIVSLNGGRAPLADCLLMSLRNALPLAAIVFLAVIAIVLGFVVLIVPGVMLSCTWAVLVPVRVVEQTSVAGTFRRSAALTRGHRWPIFGLFAMDYIVAIALGWTLRLASGIGFTVPGHMSVAYLVLSGILGSGLAMLSATGIAAIYYELRLIKEGGEPEQLAEIFA